MAPLEGQGASALYFSILIYSSDQADEWGQPTIKPFAKWDEIEKWKEIGNDLCAATFPLEDVYKRLPNRRRTIVCHDMAGGFLHDR